jgi:hypothetical protein
MSLGLGLPLHKMKFFGGYTPLFTTVGGAAFGYSLRRLSSTATNCIRVRRSGDSAEFDFGFVNNYLDTASLIAFCIAGGGTQNGNVVTWYDQSGNNYHVTNATPAQQPTIVTSGVLTTDGSRGAIGGDGGDSLLFTLGAAQSQPATIFMVARTTGAGGTGVFGSGGTGWAILANSATALSLNAGSSLSSGSTSTSRRLIYGLVNGASSVVAVNGAAGTSGNAGANTSQTIRLFADATGGSMTGNIQECIGWFNNRSSDKSLIENNINLYYGIY